MKLDIETKEFKDLARFSKAMSHPVRLQILRILSRSACCYTGDISDELPIARSTLSQHIKELKEAGLIQGTYTPPKIRYCLDAENWEKAKKLYTDFFDQEIENTIC